jgi:DNA-binding winged helix-turn-helix (wHTH) protein
VVTIAWKAAARRAQDRPHGRIAGVKRFGAFVLDTINQTLLQDGRRVELSPKSFGVLHHMVANAGRLLRHDELLAAVWPSTFVQPEILKTHIRMLRRALADDAGKPRFIETRARLGYCFIAEVADLQPDRAGSAEASPRPAAPPAALPGHAAQAQRLRAALAAAMGGERRIVFVTGEAGAGKTGLLDGFAEEALAAGEAWVAIGCGLPGRHAEPLQPVLEVLGAWCRGPHGATVRRLIGLHAPACRALIAGALGPAAGEPRRGGDGAQASRVLREVADLIECMAELRPVLLLLDDLHWMDEATLALLSLLARRPGRPRLLVVAAARAEAAGHGHPLRRLMLDLLVHRAAEEVALQPLTEPDIAAWLAQLGAGPAPERLATLLHDCSDGNPMLAAALLDDLGERGEVTRGAGFALRGEPDRATLRTGAQVNRILDLEIEALSPEEALVLEAAAVAGRTFCTWSVYTVLDMPPTTAEEHCRSLVRRGLLREIPQRTVLPDGAVSPHFGFVHGLFRDILHQRQAVARRAVWHRRLGERAEANWGKRAPVIAAELAYRFREGQDWRRAILYSRHAAAEALQKSGHDEALALLHRAREGCRHLPEAEREEVEAALETEIARLRHGAVPAAPPPRRAPPRRAGERARPH